MDNLKTGQLIAAIRKSKNMTQQSIANELNITSKAVSKWERGLSFPDVGILEKLADTLGITVIDLFNGEIIDTETVDTSIAVSSVKDAVHLSTSKISRRTKGILLIAMVLFVIAIFLMIVNVVKSHYGIGMAGGSAKIHNVAQISAVEIVLRHETEDFATDYEVTITDEVIVDKILGIYNTMRIRNMSKPLENDKFVIVFFENGLEIATWHIDATGMTTGSTLGVGNHIIENENFNYSYFLQLYYENLIDSLGVSK